MVLNVYLSTTRRDAANVLKSLLEKNSVGAILPLQQEATKSHKRTLSAVEASNLPKFIRMRKKITLWLFISTKRPLHIEHSDCRCVFYRIKRAWYIRKEQFGAYL